MKANLHSTSKRSVGEVNVALSARYPQAPGVWSRPCCRPNSEP